MILTLTAEQWRFVPDDLAHVDSRVASRVTYYNPGGCWLWQGSLDRYGYGAVRRHSYPGAAGGRWKIHRFVYTALIGPIPEGMVIDHLCRVRHCVNPEHLRACTQGQNVLAPGSEAPVAKKARQTHCKNGHEFTPENTTMRQGRRGCRTCLAAYYRERDRKRRQRGEKW